MPGFFIWVTYRSFGAFLNCMYHKAVYVSPLSSKEVADMLTLIRNNGFTIAAVLALIACVYVAVR